MLAMVMNAPGPPEVLTVQDIPEPGPLGATDILVRLRAAGVNPIDTKLRSRGTYFPDRGPAILGCDGAGVVEQAGAAVTRFKPGDAVYFCHGGIGGHPGSYAQYALLDEAFAAHKPAAMDFALAATVPLVLITAWEALHLLGNIQPRQRVLIHGGAGGVGHVAIQLARQAGARVATTVSSPEKAEFAARLGAERVILYREEDFRRAVLDWSDGAGVDLALDTVGGAVFAHSFAALRHYGRLVTLLQPGRDVDWRLARVRNLSIAFCLMLTPMAEGLRAEQRRQVGILERGAQLIDAGALTVKLTRTFALEQAAAAHRYLEQGGVTGKVALVIK